MCWHRDWKQYCIENEKTGSPTQEDGSSVRSPSAFYLSVFRGSNHSSSVPGQFLTHVSPCFHVEMQFIRSAQRSAFGACPTVRDRNHNLRLHRQLRRLWGFLHGHGQFRVLHIDSSKINRSSFLNGPGYHGNRLCIAGK
jgi:hypothetical protein